MKAAAIYAREFSWRVVPLHSYNGGKCSCGGACKGRSAGKHPRLADWAKAASNDPEQVAEWIAKWPDANVGIATGEASGFFVLDIDPKNGGDASLLKLIEAIGPLPETVEAITGSGGSHYLFELPDFPVTNSPRGLRAYPGIDIRGNGGQIVASPSRTANAYRWKPGHAPWEHRVAKASTGLKDLLRAGSTSEGPQTVVTEEDRGFFPPASPAVLEAARVALERHGPAIDGKSGGLHTVQAGAILTHDFALTDDEAWPLFVEWGETCQPPWDPEGTGEDSLRERLSRGRKYGKAEYGNRRSADAVETARKLTIDWQTGEKTEEAQWTLIERVRKLAAISGDPAKRGVIENELRVATGLNASQLALPRAQFIHDDAKPTGSIEVTTRLHEVADAATKAIASKIFQRNGVLVEVVETNRSIMIHEMEPPRIQDRMSRASKWVRQDEKRGIVSQAAPANIATILAARRTHRGVRILDAITAAPVFLADGSILQERGYNAQARVYLEPAENLAIDVADRPSRDDAREAVAVFEDLLCDVLFISRADFSTWLAALLSPLVKSATGNAPAPLFCISAASPGAGKTLLAKVIAQIITGGDAEIRTYNTRDPGEWIKKLTTFVRMASPVSVFDNVNGAIGDETLDKLVTSSTWSDRILGASDAPPMPNVTTWLATGNNIEPVTDTVRRALSSRMDVLDERPERRTGFKYSLSRGYALEHRSELLSSALTILRAFHVADRPAQGLPEFASFEVWSSLVRDALVWAGAEDPFKTQERLALECNESETESHDFWIGVVTKSDGTKSDVVREANRQDAQLVLNLRDPVSSFGLKKILGRFVDKPRAGQRIRRRLTEAGERYTVEEIAPRR